MPGSVPNTRRLTSRFRGDGRPRRHQHARGEKLDLGLNGKKAIVTGGSRGIGRAICELLADEGCDVALCARGEAGIEEAMTALAGKGVKAHGGIVDVSDTQALRQWVADAAGHLGGLDIFVANVSALAQAMDEEFLAPQRRYRHSRHDRRGRSRDPAARNILRGVDRRDRHDRCHRDCRGTAALRLGKGGARPLRQGVGPQPRRQGRAREHGVAGQRLFQRRGLEHGRAEQP